MQNEDREKIYCTKNNDTEEKQKAIFGAMRGPFPRGKEGFQKLNGKERKDSFPHCSVRIGRFNPSRKRLPSQVCRLAIEHLALDICIGR